MPEDKDTKTIVLQGIPRVFWYSLSFSIFVATCGLVYIAYRSAEVTIEIANTKINLSGAASELERANREVRQQVTQLEADLARRNAELEAKALELKRLAEKVVPAEAKAIEPKAFRVNGGAFSNVNASFEKQTQMIEGVKSRLQVQGN